MVARACAVSVAHELTLVPRVQARRHARDARDVASALRACRMGNGDHARLQSACVPHAACCLPLIHHHAFQWQLRGQEKKAKEKKRVKKKKIEEKKTVEKKKFNGIWKRKGGEEVRKVKVKEKRKKGKKVSSRWEEKC